VNEMSEFDCSSCVAVECDFAVSVGTQGSRVKRQTSGIAIPLDRLLPIAFVINSKGVCDWHWN
jgi:hypothetical protein